MATHILGYDSAIEVFRRAGGCLAGRPRELVSLRACGAPDPTFAESDICRWLGASGPVHLLVATPAQKRRSTALITHVWGMHDDEWPAIRLSDDVLVSSPEFVYLQMAQVLREPELTFLGFELCGCYGYAVDHITQRGQLATPESVSAFLEARPGVRGRVPALHALEHVLGNSGSPMETELVMRLCLPRLRGGWGMPSPTLNEKLELGPLARRAIGWDSITPDVYWKRAGLVLEYDSDEEHTGAEHISRDAGRRLAYDSVGLHAITVTNDMLRHEQSFEALARTVAKATGKKLRPQDRKSILQRRELQRHVHALATHPELLLCSAH